METSLYIVELVLIYVPSVVIIFINKNLPSHRKEDLAIYDTLIDNKIEEGKQETDQSVFRREVSIQRLMELGKCIASLLIFN